MWRHVRSRFWYEPTWISICLLALTDDSWDSPKTLSCSCQSILIQNPLQKELHDKVETTILLLLDLKDAAAKGYFLYPARQRKCSVSTDNCPVRGQLKDSTYITPNHQLLLLTSKKSAWPKMDINVTFLAMKYWPPLSLSFLAISPECEPNFNWCELFWEAAIV